MKVSTKTQANQRKYKSKKKEGKEEGNKSNNIKSVKVITDKNKSIKTE